MHLLLAHNEYGAQSGEEHAVASVTALLRTRGHTVRLLTRSSNGIGGLTGKIRACVSGVYSFASREHMLDALISERPDLVQVQNLYPLLSPSILLPCKQHGVPVIMRCPNYRLFCPNGLHLSHGEICERCLGGREYWCVLRNCERNYPKSFGYALRNAAARITRSILNNVSMFIVLSEFQKKRFINGGIEPERLEVVPNVVPDIDSCVDPTNPADLITFVGRASPEKGIEDFVAAAHSLPQLPFAVAGATERMPELVANSPPNIRWLGFLKEKELNAIYSQSRLLVFPFRWFEGFPNVITRAMVMQKPVIAARIGAVPEIVEDGKTGLLFKMADVEDLVARIKELYPDTDRCRAMGAAGRAKASAQYSPDVVYRRLMEIYAKALGHAV